ncbi:hypothetical protein K469DRAFT_276726 [Zopfia rhizophila CBS 207.26]|uniref:Uncharacterized protein n=1 Tax=Zopfia rhizophila CBS 207.26 TaxID=1314779 RepID=A0A6A6DQJ3_9PEZI|nr:hypothetical protein K469DRAFT_276726 [Zopfia rhizophila CBS 207.26]
MIINACPHTSTLRTFHHLPARRKREGAPASRRFERTSHRQRAPFISFTGALSTLWDQLAPTDILDNPLPAPQNHPPLPPPARCTTFS